MVVKAWREHRRALRVLLALLVFSSVMLFVSRVSGTTLRAGGHTYRLEVVTTTKAQEQGLSGRMDLPANQGMLFSFTDQAVRCFWMKDMHFPLDMIWADGSKRVVYVERNVNPDSYPKTYCPAKPARYVIELNAGEAGIAGITTGQTLKF